MGSIQRVPYKGKGGEAGKVAKQKEEDERRASLTPSKQSYLGVQTIDRKGDGLQIAPYQGKGGEEGKKDDLWTPEKAEERKATETTYGTELGQVYTSAEARKKRIAELLAAKNAYVAKLKKEADDKAIEGIQITPYKGKGGEEGKVDDLYTAEKKQERESKTKVIVESKAKELGKVEVAKAKPVVERIQITDYKGKGGEEGKLEKAK